MASKRDHTLNNLPPELRPLRTQKQVANMLSLSEQRIKDIEDNALKKLGKHLKHWSRA